MASKNDRLVRPSSHVSDAEDALEYVVIDDINQSEESSPSQDFENVHYPPPLTISLEEANGMPQLQMHSAAALNQSDMSHFLDSDGRIIEEHKFRLSVFRGGIDPAVRKDAWQFLFELYPFHSTRREREVMHDEYHIKYIALRKRWKEHIDNLVKSKATEDALKLQNPSYLKDVAESPSLSPPQSPDPHKQQQITFQTMQAEVFAGRLRIDDQSFIKAAQLIDKDVPRTDRGIPYFSGDTHHLRMLRNVLCTYAMVNPKVGYTQGMNDIVSRFMVVFDSEVESYWCFEKYMERVKDDFLMLCGVQQKLESVRKLLSEIDHHLMNYIKYLECDDMTFCHRWMILSFKREFKWEDSMKCFEILSSHHLELHSLEAEKTRAESMQKDFASQGGDSVGAAVPFSPDYTFEVFMCVALLLKNRHTIYSCKDGTEIFAFVSRLAFNVNLNSLLRDTEVLFYKYCQKAATDCFQVVDAPAPRISKRAKPSS